MRLFLYEYACAQEPDVRRGIGSVPVEGAAMFRALADDFRRAGAAVESLARDDEQAFRDLAARCDGTLIIAPEFDDILRTRCQWVEEAGGRLLGPGSGAVARTADKLALAGHLRRCGVPTPHVWPVSDRPDPPPTIFPAVLKPRHGAGSLATFLVRRPDEWPRLREQARREGGSWEWILQPYVEGRPASVAFLTGPRQTIPLLPAAQRISPDGRFRYLGGRLPLPAALCDRAVRLASRAVAAVPGLAGYVGVDLVLGTAEDGSRDYVLEINPRLTTSYVGLRAMTETNLAAAMVEVVAGRQIEPILWKRGAVVFEPNGEVEYRP